MCCECIHHGICYCEVTLHEKVETNCLLVFVANRSFVMTKKGQPLFFVLYYERGLGMNERPDINFRMRENGGTCLASFLWWIHRNGFWCNRIDQCKRSVFACKAATHGTRTQPIGLLITPVLLSLGCWRGPAVGLRVNAFNQFPPWFPPLPIPSSIQRKKGGREMFNPSRDMCSTWMLWQALTAPQTLDPFNSFETGETVPTLFIVRDSKRSDVQFWRMETLAPSVGITIRRITCAMHATT